MALAVASLARPHLPVQAQTNTNGYGTDVVGYYNVSITNGYQFIVNQLDGAPNTLNHLIPSAPHGTRVWLWNVTNQVFDPPATFDASNSTWDVNLELAVGRGAVVYSPTEGCFTFSGEVLQGWLTNFVAGSNRFSLLGSKVPQGGALSSVLAFPGSDGDNVYLFPTPRQSYLDACTCFSGHGWFDPAGGASTNGPVIAVGQSFFVQHSGPDTNWVRHFTRKAELEKGRSVPRS
ncbi:MAG TPA: hypothetical protein P5038_19250 [Candidatus Paceibacterota bacterium]|nr:hypothetical protein [Candidatus Paceibacterota bacterium]